MIYKAESFKTFPFKMWPRLFWQSDRCTAEIDGNIFQNDRFKDPQGCQGNLGFQEREKLSTITVLQSRNSTHQSRPESAIFKKKKKKRRKKQIINFSKTLNSFLIMKKGDNKTSEDAIHTDISPHYMVNVYQNNPSQKNNLIM